MFCRTSLSAILLLPFAGVGHAQIEFGNRIKLTDPISKIEFSEAVDMDGDGDTDIFVATDYALRVDWWENDGSGNFIRHTWRPDKVLEQKFFGLGDWNRDGRKDLWLVESGEVTGAEGSVIYLVSLGESGGGFAPPFLVIDTQMQNTSQAEPLLADLDGNGTSDIIGQNKVFLGNQDGTYSPGVDLPVAARWDDTVRVITHDYDGDGDQDLFTADGFGSGINYFENLGQGQFGAAVKLFEPIVGELSQAIAFVPSMDEEAPPLLAVLIKVPDTNSQILRTYRRTPEGSPEELGNFILPDTEGESSLLWFNPHTDHASSRGFISCLVDSSSTHLYEIKQETSGLTTLLLNTLENVTPFGFTSIRDMDDDGIDDLVVPVPWSPGTNGSASDHVIWYPGDTDGNFSSTPEVVIPPFYERRLLRVCDLDGDGDNDLLFENLLPFDSLATRGLHVWSNHGDGRCFDKQAIPMEGHSIQILAVEDFISENLPDGSLVPNAPFPLPAGRTDLILATSHGLGEGDYRYKLISIAYQDENGSFFVHPIEIVSDSSLLFYEDWDGDGMKDILVRDTAGNVFWMKRNLDRFNAQKLIMNLPGGIYSSGTFDFIDMDLDGDLDLFATGDLFGPGSSYWAERDAAGEILSVRKLPEGMDLLGFDADGDGRDEFTNLTGEILKLGSGVTFEITPYSFPIYRGILSDVDGDSDWDSVISAPTFGTLGFQRLFWSENDGSNTQQGFGVELPIDPVVEFALRDQLALCDMDGDGTKDLLVVSSDTALVEWFKITNHPGPAAFAGWMAAQDLTGSSAGPLGDWDKDGRSNWEEFLFGTFAKINDNGIGALPRMEDSGEGMEYVFTRRKTGGGLSLSYPMQRSVALDNDWEPWLPATQDLTDFGDYEEVRIPVAPSRDAEFFRIQLPEIPE